jgi:hypothetical protein
LGAWGLEGLEAWALSNPDARMLMRKSARVMEPAKGSCPRFPVRPEPLAGSDCFFAALRARRTALPVDNAYKILASGRIAVQPRIRMLPFGG